tara:strand:- start:4253 stop:4891 length:639 start_codon:yes stop_codon:yes gene_type:complete
MESQVNWLTLTDLGRRFGLSAVGCGRILSTAGMRDDDGLPSDVALDGGYAYRRPDQNANRSVLWHEERCTELLQSLGLHAVDEQQLVSQWADLLSALDEGSPSISASAEQMAEDMPKHLVAAVNARLQLLGCGFQVARSKQRHRAALVAVLLQREAAVVVQKFNALIAGVGHIDHDRLRQDRIRSRSDLGGISRCHPNAHGQQAQHGRVHES